MQILDELIIAGELQDSSKKSVLRVVSWTTRHSRVSEDQYHFQVAQSDSIEEAEVQEDSLARLGSLAQR